MAAIISMLLILAAHVISIGPAQTTPPQTPDSPSGVLMVSVAEAVQGDTLTMTVLLKPLPGKELVIKTIRVADNSTWQLVDHPSLPITARGPMTFPIRATALRAAKSQPGFIVGYESGGEVGELALAGEWVQVQRQQGPFLAWMVQSWIGGVIFGAILSILTTLIVTLLTKWFEQWIQTRRNRERVHSLLDMLCYQALDAAENGKPMDTQAFRTIYEAEGLYQVLVTYRLRALVRALWMMSQNHNTSVNKRESLHSASELIHAVNRLQERLSHLDRKPSWLREHLQAWIAGILRWYKSRLESPIHENE